MIRYLIAGVVASLLAFLLVPVALRLGRWLGEKFSEVWDSKMGDDDEGG